MSKANGRYYALTIIAALYAPLFLAAQTPSKTDTQSDRMGQLWSDLASDEAAKVDSATSAFAQMPMETTRFFAANLKPVLVDEAKTKQWLIDLGSDQPDVRRAAAVELDYIAPLVDPKIVKSLEKGPRQTVQTRFMRAMNEFLSIGHAPAGAGHIPFDENSRKSWNRSARAVKILEKIGSPDAMALIEKLAKGHFEAVPTQAAEDALIRIGKATLSPEVAKIKAIFEKHRAAEVKGDIRTMLSCLTPEMRDDAVFEAYFVTRVRQLDPKIEAVLKKFGVDQDAFVAEWQKRTKDNKDADLQKARLEYFNKVQTLEAEYQKKTGKGGNTMPDSMLEHLGPPPEDKSRELILNILLEKVSDKVGFVVEIHETFRDPNLKPVVIGDLTNIRVRGDVAIGQYTSRLYHLQVGPATVGGKPKEQWHGDDVPGKRRFSKTKEGWLIVF